MSRTSWIMLTLAALGTAAVVAGALKHRLPAIGDEVDPAHRTYPQLAKLPHHEIEIAGTAPPRFDLRLTAYYLTDGSPGCESMPTLLAGVLEGATFNSRVGVPLRVERQGMAFTARLTVDRFIPGQCDWQFGYVKAVVSKGSLVSLPNYIVIARNELNSPLADTPFGNSSDIPVTLRCSFKQLEELPAGYSRNACVIPALSSGDKQQHYLTRPTKRIVIHFMDHD